MLTTTLRRLLRKHRNLSVLTRGDHGVPYEFDFDAVEASREAH